MASIQQRLDYHSSRPKRCYSRVSNSIRSQEEQTHLCPDPGLGTAWIMVESVSPYQTIPSITDLLLDKKIKPFIVSFFLSAVFAIKPFWLTLRVDSWPFLVCWCKGAALWGRSNCPWQRSCACSRGSFATWSGPWQSPHHARNGPWTTILLTLDQLQFWWPQGP